MTTSRLISATSDTNYVIPAIMVKKSEYTKYYYEHAVHIGAHNSDECSSFCGQEHISVMTEVSVEEAPKITCNKCLSILWHLVGEETDSKKIHEAVNRKLGARLQMVHVKKERPSKRTNAEPINPLEEEPVDRLLGPPIEEIPVAYHRDKTLEQRLAMLRELSNYMTKKYHTFKPLYNHSVQLAKCGFSTSFSNVIEDYNRERGNLQLMITELNKTMAKA